MLTRRQLLRTAAALVPLSLRAADPPLNVLLILADDLGWSDLGCYGADLHETPHIDRLAASGMRFADAYSAAPVCSPTRASILTGKHPARLHMTTWIENAASPAMDKKLIPPTTAANLPYAETTIAEVLRERNYLNALVGKWHLGTAPFYPETQGFDIDIGGTGWGAPYSHFYPYRGEFDGELRYVPHLEFGMPGEYLADRLTTEAIGVMDRAKDRPFFLYLAHHSVHTPIEAKDADIRYFGARRTPAMKHRNAAYAAMTRSLDDSVGRMMRRLDETGLAANTVVIFMSDNGGAIHRYRNETITNNAPLRSGKGALYEGGIRVPLIVRWPGVTHAGSTCGEPVVSTDLYATALDIAGMRESAGFRTGVDSTSLRPLLANPAATLARDALCFHYPHYYVTTAPVSAIRHGRWKLLEFLEDGKTELYDLASDLGETRDAAGANPAVRADLYRRLREWRASVGAQMPTLNRTYR
jgi:arylsulfatase A